MYTIKGTLRVKASIMVIIGFYLNQTKGGHLQYFPHKNYLKINDFRNGLFS